MTVSTVEAAVQAKELRRWLAWLGGSLIAACIFTALALAGFGAWWILAAIIAGPGVGGGALVILAIKSDTNHIVHAEAAEALPAVAEAAA